jgi:hemolysin III
LPKTTLTPSRREKDARAFGPNYEKANARHKRIPTTRPSSHVPLDTGVVQPNAPRVKPRWRGFLHQYGFFIAIVPAVVLVATAPTGNARISAAVYVASLLALLGTSALYHRIDWSPRARFWMGRVDTTMIFVLIAGSFTPVALLLPSPTLANASLLAVWGASGIGAILVLASTNRPKWASSALYVTMTALGVVLFLPQLAHALGFTATAMLAASGMVYLLGALVYGSQRPDPWPNTFGYHEVFHGLVLVAATLHFVTVAVYILPLES